MRGASRVAFGGGARPADRGRAPTRRSPPPWGTSCSRSCGLLDREPGLRRALADYTSAAGGPHRAGARPARRPGVRGHPRRGLRDWPARAGRCPGTWPTRPRNSPSWPRPPPPAARATWTTSRTNCSGSAGSPAASPSCSPPWPTSGCPTTSKRALLDALLTGKVAPASLRLITQAVINPRGRNLEANLADYARLVADWRQRLIAVVRVATELSDEPAPAAHHGALGHLRPRHSAECRHRSPGSGRSVHPDRG